jgi:hypothetical protein
MLLQNKGVEVSTLEEVKGVCDGGIWNTFLMRAELDVGQVR